MTRLTPTVPDQNYTEASAEALGRSFALMFRGMMTNGMTREESLHVLMAYVAAIAADQEEEADDDT